MISERVLRQWRRDVLQREHSQQMPTDAEKIVYLINELGRRILRLTQELMDLHLIRKG